MAIEWGVSADSSGLLTGSPAMWKRLWQGAIDLHPPRGFVGYEMFPWWGMWGARRIWCEAQREGLPVASIHGRTGGIHDAYSWWDRVVMMGLNEIMPDSVNLIQKFGTKVPRIVLHAPEFRNRQLREYLLARKDSLPQIAIENHIHIGSGGTVVDVALELKEDLEIKDVAVVFDVFHCADASDHHGNNWKKRWDGVRRQAGWILNNGDRYGFKVHFHLPVGPGRDGLPSG